MARARMGAIVSSVTGSIGGLTFAETRNGQVIRRRPAKVTKNSFGLERYQARFANAARAWGSLTDAQRAGWQTVAQEVNSKTSPGQQRWTSGRQLFLSEAFVAARTGIALPTDPPTRRSRPFWAVTTPSWTSSGLLVTYARSSAQASGQVIMEGCRAMSSSGFSAKLFKVFIITNYGASGTFNWTAIFTTNVGAPDIGEYFALRIRTKETGGLWSLPWQWQGKRIS